MERKTVVLRKCLNCSGTLGIGIWPWSGVSFTVSHGLCDACFLELEAAAAAEPEPEQMPAPSWVSPGGV